MKNLLSCLYTFALITTPILAHAENSVYVGATAGYSIFKYDDVENGTATKLLLGVQLDEHIIYEASYYDSGKSTITSLCCDELNINGMNFSVLYNLSGSTQNHSVIIGAGMYRFKTKVISLSTVEIDSTGVSLTAGAHYKINENIFIRADVNGFIGVNDFADDQSVTSFNLGGIYQF